MQTKEQKEAVISEFNQSILPAVLADNDANGMLVLGYLNLKFGVNADLSIDRLRKAVTSLVGQLDWKVKPKSLLRDEAAAAGITLDKDDPRKTDDSAQKKQIATELQKMLDAETERVIAAIISDAPPVIVGGRISVAKTEARRRDLAGIEARKTHLVDGKVVAVRDPMETLRLVQKFIRAIEKEEERGQLA